jgi:hypothetical protein
MTVFRKLLVVYRAVRSLRVGCIYKRVDVMAVRVWCLLSCCGTVAQHHMKDCYFKLQTLYFIIF